MYQTETTTASSTELNQRFGAMLKAGQTKQAEEIGNAFIRTRVRQEAAVRMIIIPQKLNEDELSEDLESDEPRKIVDKEPNSKATYVPFDGTPAATWYRGRKYAVYFGKTQSDIFVKSKYKLLTYNYDIRKVLADNSVKDMADQEDIFFRRTALGCVNANAGVQRTPAGAFTPSAFVRGSQAIINRRLPMGKMLMTQSLFQEAMNLPATLIGDSIARKHYEQGVEKEDSLWGMPVITTAKTDVYNTQECWMFAPQNYLGNFFLLQDATLFIEQRADMITFWTYAVPGIGIGNAEAIQQIVFGQQAQLT